MSNQTKQQIQHALQQFNQGHLKENSLHLLAALGYKSDRQIDLDNSPEAFLEAYDSADVLRGRDKALLADWQTVDVLCQITDAEIRQSNQMILLDSAGKVVDNAIIESYLFMAIALRGEQYTRTQLAHITREVNRLFQMPVMLLFRHGETLTLSIINRRLHKREQSKDVLEKVTLVKDIRIANPHRAHVEILFDLSLAELYREHKFSNFVELHQAWQKTLDSSELNKRFFKEIADWYFWAVNEVVFPQEAGPDETRQATSVIRLITRLIFVWFLKEKGLVPDELFNRRQLDALLTWDDPQGSTYYKAILQNLFFATLNQEMNTTQKSDNRKFRAARESGQSHHFMIHNLYRYERYFRDPVAALALFADVPFLNGGLFECLDRRVEGQDVRVDGFSDRTDNPLRVPDELFFGDERTVDLNDTYGTSGKRYTVRPIIETLNRYKFTITENTPIEEEIALDPELLGKVFENLLAAYNPETGTTARKQTGSFYTPREIVNYMVDESLLAYLQTMLQDLTNLQDLSNLDGRLRHLFAYNEEPHQFDAAEVAALITAVDQVKILDPACGSGAFPMGILHKLVFILGKLDPHNVQWKERQIEPIRQAIKAAAAIPDSRIRNQTIQELEEQIAAIEAAFARNELDYGRKLYLIENCIYGVDIQPIAVQIAKLRFFISLVVDQRLDEQASNRGILPLPNLETKFVAANTLLGIEKPQQMALRNPAITEKEKELAEVRSKHFRARTLRTKEKWRAEDKRLRAEIGDLLQQEGNLPNEDVRRLAGWDPYDQNNSAAFFDPEWMFGLESGFDVVIGNPPYINVELVSREVKNIYAKKYRTFYKRYDVFGLFFELSLENLIEEGIVSFIIPAQVLNNLSFKKLRELILANRWLREVFYLGDKIFESANNDVCVLFLYKPEVDSIRLVNALDFEERVTHQVPVTYFDKFNGVISFSADSVTDSISDKIFNPAFRPIRQEFNVFQGIVTGNNALYVLTPEQTVGAKLEKDLLRPVLLGRDFEKWMFRNTERQILYVDGSVKLENYPRAYAYLSKFKEQILSTKSIDEKSTAWYSLHRPREKSNLDYTPKILVQGTRNPRLQTRVVATLDTLGVYGTQGVNFILPVSKDAPDIKFLLAILNSTLINYLYKTKFLNVAIKAEYLKDTPIPIATPQQQQSITNLVDQILAAKQADPTADVSAWEREIDELVYALYGLTPAEIALVEGREPVRSNRFSGETAEAVTTNVTTNAAPPLIFTGQPPQGSFPERLKRVQALTKQATPAAIQELVAALADENPTIVWTAAAGLRQIGGPQVVGVLQAFMEQVGDTAAKEEAEKVYQSLL